MYFKKYLRCRICFYILIVIASFTESVDPNNTNNTAVCKTPGCKAAAHIIKRTINPTEDPCNNFYNFVCGNFISNHKLKKYQNETGRTSLLIKKVTSNLKQALSENIDPNEPRTFKLVKNYYNACMDIQTINNMGLQPLLNIINDLGGWPMVVGDTWDENNFDWMKTLYKLRQYGYLGYILRIFVGVKPYNTKSIIEIAEGTTVLDPYILKSGWNHPRFQDYHKYILDVATLLGADFQIANSEAYDAINFEANLTKYADASFVNLFIGPISVVDYSVPEIPWLDLINNLTSPVANFTMTDEVQVYKRIYLGHLAEIFQNVSKRIVANYLIWRVIYDSAPYLSNDIRQLHDYFNNINEPNRHEHCINLLKDDEVGIPVGLDAIYIRKYSNNETRDDVQNVIKYISGQMDFYINKLTWLDNQTRNGALEKLRLMERIVAYPDDFYNYTKMDRFTSNLHIDPKNHLQNFLNIQLFNFERHILTLNGPADDDSSFDTDTSYAEVNAFYQPDHNRIKINAAFLQPPLYSNDWPNYMKYGSIGKIIGHEMMHAFDSLGFRFDATGKWKQWYTNQNALEYENKMQCFVRHYEKYHNKRLNLSVNGSRTLNENLADYGGVATGYTGYKKWVEKNGKELPLPGLSYTPEQIFWIMVAVNECSNSRKSVEEYLLLNEAHTLGKYRVFGMVSNSADFAKDFNCPVGSRMNPKKKCSLL